MKKSCWFLACIVLAGIAGLVVSAQGRKPVSEQLKFSKVPFDATARQLPARYLGHSLIDIWGFMLERKKAMEQGEYETSPAWASRLAKLNNQPLTGTITPTSIFAFKLNDTETSYSADSEALTITANTQQQTYDSINEQGLSSFQSALWWYDNRKGGSFIGANAFGVKRRVQVEKETGYFLVFKSGIIGQANTLKIDEVSIEQAKAIRPQLRVLLIGTLTDPYVGGDKDETGATLDDPVKTSTINFYTYLEPQAFWFYNYETGEVYYRADLKQREKPKAQK